MTLNITWTVGRRLAAIAGIGAVTSVIVAGVAYSGFRGLEEDSDQLAAYQDARSLMHALDTRSSELKVDGLKAAVYPDNEAIADDVVDDTATIDDLMAELHGLDLVVSEDQTKAFDQAWADYETSIASYVDGAIADQQKARKSVEDVQAANDKMDELLSGSIEAIEKSADARTAEADGTRSTALTLLLVAALLGLVAL